MRTSIQRKAHQSKGSESTSRSPASRSSRIQRAPLAGGVSRGGGLDRAGSALFRGAGVQAKAIVGRAGDKYEKEADVAGERIAKGEYAPDIRRMSDGALSGGKQRLPQTGGTAVQALQLQPEEEEEPIQALQRQPEEEEEEPVQALQRQPEEEEEEPVQALQRQPEEEEEEPDQALQRQPEEEKGEPVQALQRQSEEEEAPVQALQRQTEDEEETVQTLQLRRNGQGSVRPPQQSRRSSAPSGFQQAADRAATDPSIGEPLESSTKSRLEHGLGADLSEVRVHRDSNAQSLASGLRAKAFTRGKDIYLGSGQSESDMALMGHESAHVLQQGGVVRRPPNAAGNSTSAPARAAAEPATAREAQSETVARQQPEDLEQALPAEDSAATPSDAEQEAGADSVPSTGAQGEETAGAEDARTQGGDGEDKESEKSKEDTKKAKSGEAGGKPASAGTGARGSDAGGKQKLKQVLGKVKKEATKQKGPAASKSSQTAAAKGAGAAASAAAPVPAKEAESEGQTTKVQNMDSQEKGEVKEAGFMELVEQKLAQLDTPSTPEAMSEFKQKGGAGQLRGQVVGGVKEQAGGAQQAIKGASTAAVAPPPQREAKPLPEQPAAPTPGDPRAQDVVVPPKSNEEISLQASQDDVEGKLAENRLTKERLEKANDPRFSEVQSSREEVAANVKEAPEKFRGQEQDVRGRQKSLARADQGQGLSGMQASNTDASKKVSGEQHAGMDKETAKRQEAINQIQGMYTVVEKKVNDKLAWLDGEVDRLFDAGEKKARADFETFVDDELSSWKLRRYGSRALIPVIGTAIAAGTWVYDKVRGIDHFPEVQKIFSDGRDRYLAGLRSTIKRIATVVETSLTWCKTEIANGKKEIDAFVKSRDEGLQKALTETVDGVFGKFDDLSTSVDEKKEALADKLVQRYKDSRQAIDKRIEEMRAANKGLVHAFIGKLKAVLEAIANFRKRLVPILHKAGNVVEDILDDPIGFLGNLLSAVKQGFKRFMGNIATHLKAGLVGWLFGTMAQMGLEPPKEFSLKAIVGFIMQVLGITWERIRPKVVRLIGERNVTLIEKVAGYVQKLFAEGPAGLWQEIKDYVGGIKDMVIGAIKEFVVTKIVTAAVTKLVSMFNPVGAIVQAVLTIYNVIMFFIERIQQILALVESVVQSAVKVVKGQVAEAAAFIEKSMALTVPIIISFLARLLGIGGIANKIKSIVKKVQKKISKAIDKALRKIVSKFKKLFGRKGDNKGSSKASNREQDKKRAYAEVKKAMTVGIRRSKLKRLVKKLKRKYDLKQAVLTKGDDVVLRNSDPETAKGAPVEDTTTQKGEFSSEMRVTEKRPTGPEGKMRRKKVSEGGIKIGTFSATAPTTATVAGVIKDDIAGFPHPEVPETAPRPTRAKADLIAKVDAIDRVAGSEGLLAVNKMGRLASFLRGGSKRDYDSGHLIANEFGGNDNFENLVPMRSAVNQEGAYRRVELWVRDRIPELSPSDEGDQRVKLSMEVRPSYGAAIKKPVSYIAERVGGYVKGTHFAKQARAARKAGEEFNPAAHEEAAEQEAAKVKVTGAKASKQLSIPARIPTRIGIKVQFETQIDPSLAKNKQKEALKSEHGVDTAGLGGKKGGISQKDPIIVAEGTQSGKQNAERRDKAKGKKKITAQKEFTFSGG